MNTPTKWIIGIVVIILVFVAVIWKQPTATSSTTQPFKIGSMIPLSGEYADLGEEVKKGADIAVAEADGRGETVEYISEDDGLVPQKEAGAANKLTQIDQVDVAFTATVQEVKATDRIFNTAKIPLLSAWDSNEYIKTAGNYIYSVGFSTEAAGGTMAEHAYSKLGLKKISVVYIEDEWSKIITDAFEKKYRELGGTILGSEKTLGTQKDYRSLIAKAKAAGAEGIYFPLFPNYCGAFMKQARELGYKGVLMTGDSLTDGDVAIAGKAAEGAYATMLFGDNLSHVTDTYQKMYGKAPMLPIFTAIGYDAVNTLVEAHRIAKKDNVALADALKQVKLNGAVGSIDMAGKRYHERIERINIVKDGKIIELK